jgi:hypothetical protein
MLDTYERLKSSGDIDDHYNQARKLLGGRGNFADRSSAAIRALCNGLLHTHARQETYARVTELLGQLFEETGRPREALTLSWYANGPSRDSPLLELVPPVDRARTYALWARMDSSQSEKLYRRAAGELEHSGLLARAAIQYELVQDSAHAGALWARLSSRLDALPSEPYFAGLARFNLARQSRMLGQEAAAQTATVEAVHRLEEAADRFEAQGQRERAFDCYHVLIAIGALSSAFEHVLEGSVNAIRILREDHLHRHALRSYEHAIGLAQSAQEFTAAATLAREMTEYARKHGVSGVAALGTLRQSDLWLRAAQSTLERGGSPQLAEAAMVAAVLANAELGCYAKVGELYRRLQELDLTPARRDHYARAAARYENLPDAQLEVSLESSGEPVVPPAVWHDDLIEWEERGSAVEACADILLDPQQRDDPVTRRAALVGRLVALSAEAASAEEQERAGILLASYLAPIRLFALLAALENLYTSRFSSVRRAAVKALGRYCYKRTFITLERALSDPDQTVAEEGNRAIEQLRFPHAFDPLVRIYRGARRPGARMSALRALARVDVEEAAELMLGVLSHGPAEERDVAIAALKDSRGARFLEAAREAYPAAPPRLKEALGKIFGTRIRRAPAPDPF